MQVKNSFSKKVYFLIILLSIITFFLNFYFKEFLITGSKGDFNSFVFRNIILFKRDFLESIIHYGKLDDANWPFYYIFHAYLNPFSTSPNSYLISTTFIGFLTFIVLSLAFKNIYFNKLESIALASLILLLPWFNGRSHWGTSANLGWFFFVTTLYFYTKFENIENTEFKKQFKSKNILIFFICFFSALSLYSRLALVFFPIFFSFIFLFSEETIKFKIKLLVYYFILSLPGWLIIYIWGGIYDWQNDQIITATHNYKNILRNLPIIFSYFFFYLWPIFLLEIYDNGSKFFKSHQKTILSILVVYFFLFFSNYFNYLSEFTYGGGVILKLGYLIKDNNLIFLITSMLGAFILYLFSIESKKNLFLIFIIIVIYGHPIYPFQDYFEPLIFLIFFCKLIKSNRIHLVKKYFNFLLIIYFFYFLMYNVTLIIYKIYFI